MTNGDLEQPVVLTPIDPCEAVARVADAIGAWGTAREARQTQRSAVEVQAVATSLCLRIERFLVEEQRAMSRTPEQARAFSQRIATWIVDFDDARAARLLHPDLLRGELAKTLAVERRKLLMASKVDLWTSMARDLATDAIATHRLRGIASSCADELARITLADWHRKMRPLVDNALAQAFRGMLAHACDGAPLEQGAVNLFAGMSVALQIGTFELRDPGRFALGFGDRLRSRERVRDAAFAAAASRLDGTLEQVSQQITEDFLDSYDRGVIAIGDALASVLDQLATYLVVATVRAREARGGGPDAVTRAYERIDRWLVHVGELRQRIG